MKKESGRDNILLSQSYSARRSVEGRNTLSVISPDDIDFEDVFGGPPRRFSYHETTRYSSDGAKDVMETARSRSLSSGKPVFGERGGVNRRERHQRNDFFDDIFQGVKSRSGSGSGSSIMGPYEPSGTSLPTHFRLASATLNKDVDNPTLAPTSTFRKKENASNGIGSSKYSLSRFSSQAETGHASTTNVQQSSLPRPLSNEVSPRNKESTLVTKSDKTGLRRDPKRDSDNTEAPSDIEHSHFSIYKWAGGEVPLVVPPLDGLGSKVDENPSYLHEISISEKTRKEVSMVTEKKPQPVPKTLHTFLQDNIEAEDDEGTGTTTKIRGKVKIVKATKMFGSNVGTSNNVKKFDEKKIDSVSTDLSKSGTQRSSKILEGKVKKSGVRGKVKDFVRKFNQETNSKPKSNLGSGSQSFRSEGRATYIGVNSSNLSTSNIDAVQFSNLNAMLDALLELDENVEQPEIQHSPLKSTFFTTTENSSHQNDASLCSDSIPDDSEVSSNKADDHFKEKNMVQDLFDNQVELSLNGEDHGANKALDADILKWSTGKEGNIRSLISTLQYVLWAESGWKPVPLVDIIELNAVKKSYQKVLLCLHPDKLQQKGADSHQKYIAEKVFDILQEAWDHFNSLDPL